MWLSLDHQTDARGSHLGHTPGDVLPPLHPGERAVGHGSSDLVPVPCLCLLQKVVAEQSMLPASGCSRGLGPGGREGILQLRRQEEFRGGRRLQCSWEVASGHQHLQEVLWMAPTCEQK